MTNPPSLIAVLLAAWVVACAGVSAAEPTGDQNDAKSGGKAQESPQNHGATTGDQMGRVLDGHRIRTIRENRAARIEFRNNLRKHVTKVVGTVAGWFGLPQRIIEGIVAVGIGLFSLCCLALFALVFSVVTWAGVSLYRGRAAK